MPDDAIDFLEEPPVQDPSEIDFQEEAAPRVAPLPVTGTPEQVRQKIREANPYGAIRLEEPQFAGANLMGPAAPEEVLQLPHVLEAPPVAIGQALAASLRALRGATQAHRPDLIPPTPFKITSGEIRPLTEEEQAEQDPLQHPERGLFQPTTTAIDPQGSDAARMLSGLSSIDSIGMIAAGEGSRVAGMALLASMAPSIFNDVKRIAGSDVPTDSKREAINNLVLPVILGLQGLRPRGELPDFRNEMAPLEFTGGELPGLPKGFTPPVPTAGAEVLGPPVVGKVLRPEVPETLPEAERGLSMLDEIREKNARTVRQIQKIFPNLGKEEAKPFRDAAFPEDAAARAAAEAGLPPDVAALEMEIQPPLPGKTGFPTTIEEAAKPTDAFELEQQARRQAEAEAEAKRIDVLNQGIITWERELDKALQNNDGNGQREAIRKLLELRRQRDAAPPPVKGPIMPKPPLRPVPRRAVGPEVPGTPAEPRETLQQTIRRNNARTVNDIREALGDPTMSKERAKEFGRQAWGEWPPPPEEPGAAPPGPEEPPPTPGAPPETPPPAPPGAPPAAPPPEVPPPVPPAAPETPPGTPGEHTDTTGAKFEWRKNKAGQQRRRYVQTRGGLRVGDKWDPGLPVRVITGASETTKGMPDEYTVTEVAEILGSNEITTKTRDMSADEIGKAQDRIRQENELRRKLGMPEIPVPEVPPPSAPGEIGFESNESLVGRTKVGPERDKAFADRAARLLEVAKSLKRGDIVVDEDGTRFEVDQALKDGTIFVFREGGSIEGAHEFHLHPDVKVIRKGAPPEAPPPPAPTISPIPGLPPVPEGMVRLYHGEGGAEGGGMGSLWFSANPERARAFGPNMTYVDVPPEVAERAQAEVRATGKGTSGDAVLPDEWVLKSKPIKKPPEQKVYEIPEEEAPPVAQKTGIERFKAAAEDPNFRGGNTLSDQVGLEVKSVADLDALLEMRRKSADAEAAALKKANDLTLPEAERIAAMQERLRQNLIGQLAAESIQVATNSGGHPEGAEVAGTIRNLGPRPLDWKKNPEAAKWLQDNAAKFGLELPDELKPPPAPTFAPGTIEARIVAGKPLGEWEAITSIAQLPKGYTQKDRALRRELADFLNVPNQPSRILGALRNKKRTREYYATPPAPVTPVTPSGLTEVSLTEARKSQIPSHFPPNTKQLPANVSFIRVVNKSGKPIAIVALPHDGTPEGVRAAAGKVQAYANDAFEWGSEIYNTNSQLGATDLTGKPKWIISPNLAHVSEVGTLSARYTLGDLDAGRKLQEAEDVQQKLLTAPPAAPPVTPEAPLHRALEIEKDFDLSPAEAAAFNHAIEVVKANPGKWTTLAEGIQKEAMRVVAAQPSISLSKLGDIKFAKRIADRYLPEAPKAPEAPAAPEAPKAGEEPAAMEKELHEADDFTSKASTEAEKATIAWATHVQDVVEPLKAKIRQVQSESNEMHYDAGRTAPSTRPKQKLTKKAFLAKYGVASMDEANALYKRKNAEWADLEKQLEAAEQKRKDLEVTKDRRGKEWSAAATRAGEIRRKLYPKVNEGDVGGGVSMGPGAAARAEFEQAAPSAEALGLYPNDPKLAHLQRRAQNLFAGITQIFKRGGIKQILSQLANAADNIPRYAGQTAGNSLRLRASKPERNEITFLMQALKMSGDGLSQEDAARLGALEHAGDPVGYLRANKTDLETAAQQFMQQGKKPEAFAASEAAKHMGNAIRHYNTLLPVARRARKQFDAQWKREQNAGVAPDYEAWYVPQRHEMEMLPAGNSPMILGESRGGISTQFKKAKVYEDYSSAIQDGFIPRTTDIADLLEHRVTQGERMLQRRQLFNQLRLMRDPVDGQPLAMNIPKRTITRPDGTSITQEHVPRDYKKFEVMPGYNLAIHRGYARLMNALTGTSQLSESAIVGTLQNIAAVEKHLGLMLDTFHASRTLQAELMLTGKLSVGSHLKRGLALVEYKPEDLNLAVEKGLITQDMADWVKTPRPMEIGGRTVNVSPHSLFVLGAKSGLNMARVSDVIYKEWLREIPLTGAVNKWVFDKMTRSAISQSFLMEFERVARKNPHLGAQRVARKVASDINVFFGNLQKESIFKNPSVRAINQILFLAPNWVEALARRELRAAKQFGEAGLDVIRGRPTGRMITRETPTGRTTVQELTHMPTFGTAAKGIGTGLAAYFIGTQVLNLFTRGHLTFQNPEEDHKLDAWIPDFTGKTNGFFISPLSVFGEITHDILRYFHREPDLASALAQIGENKFGNLARFLEVVTVGRDPLSGEKLIGTANRAMTAGRQLVPVPISLSQGGQAIGHLIAPGTVKAPTPGSVQRQVTASLGFKTEPAASSQMQVYHLADAWKSSSKVPAIRAQVERRLKEDFGPSDYKDLRLALIRDNPDDARRAYDALLQTKTSDVIRRTMEHPHPFTGSQLLEKRFVQTLTREQRQVYRDALKERIEVQRRFERMLRAKHR